MVINKDSFYLQDIELLKQLQPIMAKKGIDNDGWVSGRCFSGNPNHKLIDNGQPVIPTWRKDSLEAALPDTPYTLVESLLITFKMNVKDPRIQLLRKMLQNQGQIALETYADYIILTEKESYCGVNNE